MCRRNIFQKTDKKQIKGSKTKDNKLIKIRKISFKLIEEMNNNIFINIKEINFDIIDVTNVFYDKIVLKNVFLEEYL